MGKTKTPPPLDFTIHVDPSCLTDSTDLDLPKQREASSDTVIHNPPANDSEQTRSAAELNERREHKEAAEHPELLDEKIQAQIHEAARRVVASIERDRYDGLEDSILSSRTDESYGGEGTELTYDGTEITYDRAEGSYEMENEKLGAADEGEDEINSHIDQAITEWESENGHTEDEHEDSSSHHDGDVDDVFSDESGRSQRSSMNSIHELASSEEGYQKVLTSPAVGEEAATSQAGESVSRIPSIASYIPDDPSLRTPSKVMHRPPFRTPSSVRAMQMASPTPSIFSSPRSSKRHLPTVSRIGTPTSQFSPSKRTPTRFKAKKEEPLILLHVTVLPLQWPYSHAMASREVPASLQHVKESWGALQDKLADTVLERGILLPHPQDSYEILEERLLEALELPVRPRAKILKCGHYMGPLDLDTPSSDDENPTTESYFRHEKGSDRKWCDICRKDVKLEDTGETWGKRRFNVKIYASNGLMRAGAWAAAWREMERVDVEIEPWVEISVRGELEDLAASSTALETVAGEADDEFVDEEETEEISGIRAIEVIDDKYACEEHQSAEERELRRKFEEEELKHRMMEEVKLQKLLQEEQALQFKMEDEESRKILIEKERIREIYGQPESSPPTEPHPQTRQRSPSKQAVDPDSLPELLLAAFKVLMRDKKNIAIGILSLVVIFLALKPIRSLAVEEPQVLVGESLQDVAAQTSKEVVSYVTITATSTIEATPQTVTKVEQAILETSYVAPVVQIELEAEPVIEPVTSGEETPAVYVDHGTVVEELGLESMQEESNHESVPFHTSEDIPGEATVGPLTSEPLEPDGYSAAPETDTPSEAYDSNAANAIGEDVPEAVSCYEI